MSQELRRRQEMEQQEKEKLAVRSDRLHHAENEAIKRGIQDNGAELGADVIRQVEMEGQGTV